MKAGEYLGQEQFLFAMRPGRCAYLIADQSESGFRRAVSESCTRWGGVSEPILPVDADGTLAPLWRQLLGFANVDQLINVDLDRALSKKVSEANDLTVVELSQINSGGVASFTCHPSAVCPSANLSSKTGPFGMGEGAGLIWTGAHESLDLWAVAAGGWMTDEMVEQEQENAQAIRVSRNPLEVAWAQNSGHTLLDRTSQQFEEHFARSGPYPTSTVVWICDQNNQLDDCLHYWNRRALRSFRYPHNPMVLLPEWDTANWLGFSVRSLLEGRPDDFSPDVVLVSLHTPHGRLREIAESWSMTESQEDMRFSLSSPPPPARKEPFTYLVDMDPTVSYLFERRYGLTSRAAVQVFRDRTTAQFAGPVTFSSIGRCLVSMSAPVLDVLPHRSEVASLIMPHATWCAEGIQVATVGANMPYSFDLQIPTLRAVSDRLLDRSTDQWGLSDKGQLAEGVLGLPGEWSVSEPGVYQSAKTLVTKRARYLEKILGTLEQQDSAFDRAQFLAEAGVGRTERTIHPVARISQLSGIEEGAVLQALEAMVAWEWAERGLRVECTRCKLQSFVPISSVSSKAACPGCRAAQSYDAGTTNLTIYYRLNSLIDRAVDQGVLPHLLAREALLRNATEGHIYAGVDVTIGGLKGEADIFGVLDAKVISGEVKSSASEFTPEQLKKDFWLASCLRVDQYVMASMEDVAQEQVTIAQDLADESGIDLRVLGPDDIWSVSQAN